MKENDMVMKKNNSITTFFTRNRYVLVAMSLFVSGGILAMLSMIQKVHLLFGVLGISLLTAGLFFFCLKFLTERQYRQYYEDSYNLEHDTIEEEIRKSGMFHMYQEAVLNRYESACSDLGLTAEQREWLLRLLMEEKTKTDALLKEQGISI